MTRTLLISALVAGLAASGAFAQAATGDPYPLNTCPVSGEELGSMGEPILYDHEGREIRFCCGGCEPRFKNDPAQYLSKIDAQIIEQQKAWYPLDTCVVSGNPLGGKPYDMVYKNRLIRLASPNHAAKFKQSPDEYWAKLDEAVIAKQSKDYPFNRCLVSGDDLDGSHGDVINKVIANRLFKLCCDHCKEDLKARPAHYIAMVVSGKWQEPEGSGEKKEGEHSEHKDH